MEVRQVAELRTDRRNPSTRTLPNATLSTRNSTWPDLGTNQGRRVGRPANNSLSFGTARIHAV
jgi:hypothetical protein